MPGKNYLEIEVRKGPTFALIASSSKKMVMPSLLYLDIPDDLKTYTLQDLLREFFSKHEEIARIFLDEKTGTLKGDTVILLNGTHADLLKGSATPLKEGDRLVFLPFVDGG